MMYVVPHGDRLGDYDLPEDPTAAPGALAALAGLKQLGMGMMGLGLLGTAMHYLKYGPEVPEQEGAAPTWEPVVTDTDGGSAPADYVGDDSGGAPIVDDT